MWWNFHLELLLNYLDCQPLKGQWRVWKLPCRSSSAKQSAVVPGLFVFVSPITFWLPKKLLCQMTKCMKYGWWKKSAPVDMLNIPLFTRFYTSQVVILNLWLLRSIQALEQLRSDLLSHSTTTPTFRYKGSSSVETQIHNSMFGSFLTSGFFVHLGVARWFFFIFFHHFQVALGKIRWLQAKLPLISYTIDYGKSSSDIVKLSQMMI